MEKANARSRKHGAWQRFTAAQPPLACFGPRLPTSDEALAGLSESEITLKRIQTLYRPSNEVLEWVHGVLSRHSVEGPRMGTAEFWLKRPDPLFHSSNSFA